MSVFQGSRYTETSVYVKGDTAILEIRQRIRFNLERATYYTVIQGDTLDGIAYKKYGNAQLYWSILDANPVYQSEMDVKAGDIILIPPLEEVMKHV